LVIKLNVLSNLKSVLLSQLSVGARREVEAEKFRVRRANTAFERVRHECFPLEDAICLLCGKTFWTVRASDGCESHVRSLCKKDNLCKACSFGRSSGLADDFVRLMRKIADGSRTKLTFWRWEGTVPHDIQNNLTLDEGYAFAKEVKEFFEDYLRKAKNIDKTVKLGSIVVYQFCHTSDPFGIGTFQTRDKAHYHYHGVTFGWGVSSEDSHVVRFGNLFIDSDPRFMGLRSAWKALLAEHVGKTKANDVDCKVRYEEGTDQLYHRVRYMFRGEVEDMADYCRRNGYPEGYDREWVREALLFKDGRPRVRYFGFISPRNLAPSHPYMKRIGLELERKSVRLKEARKSYCDHGFEYEIQWHESRKTLEELKESGGTIIVRERRPVKDDFGG
jgi:hypothetical protein